MLGLAASEKIALGVLGLLLEIVQHLRFEGTVDTKT